MRRRDESRQELNVNGQVTMVIQDKVTSSHWDFSGRINYRWARKLTKSDCLSQRRLMDVTALESES